MSSDKAAIWPEGRAAKRRLRSMDGGVVADASVQRPDRHAYFRRAESAPVIPRGSGFSFAAGSFGAGATSVDVTSFDRILDMDSAAGIVEVEAGITLGGLFQFLAPRGFYLPIQPGHFGISVGGCIAADVHGKNPARDGTFIEQVESLKLFHPRHGTVELSRKTEPQLFHATCGGLGLTGVILSARLRTKLLPSTTLDLQREHLDVIAGAHRLHEEAARNDFAYGWFDFAAKGAGFGCGAIIRGNFAATPVAGATFDLPRSRFSAENRAALPLALINPLSIRVMNAAHAWMMRAPRGRSSIADTLYPTRLNEVYYRLFGRKGFHEYQAVIPRERVADYVAIVADEVRRGACVSLAVVKPFAGTSDMIRFTGDGISLALETPRSANSLAFMATLDRAVMALGGRPSIIKDSRLPRAVFEATYPECDRFRAVLRDWDPQHSFRSNLSERLGL